MFEEIAKATNRITGKEMLFAYSKGYNTYALIINGINQKCSEDREVVEHLFEHLAKEGTIR